MGDSLIDWAIPQLVLEVAQVDDGLAGMVEINQQPDFRSTEPKQRIRCRAIIDGASPYGS